MIVAQGIVESRLVATLFTRLDILLDDVGLVAALGDRVISELVRPEAKAVAKGQDVIIDEYPVAERLELSEPI